MMESVQSTPVDQEPASRPGLSYSQSDQAGDAGQLSYLELLHQEILDEIIEHLHYWGGFYVCPLMEASKRMYHRVRRRLYELELKPDNFLLGWACERGNVNLVYYLTEVPVDVSRSYVVSRSCDLDFVFHHNADAEAAIRYNYFKHLYMSTPLHIAICSKSTEIFFRLIDCGANPNARDTRDMTPLAYACTEEITGALLDAGADANAVSKGHTMLHYALDHWTETTSTGSIKLLLEKGGARPNVRAIGHFPLPPLHCAIQYGSSQLVELFLKNGADPNWASNDGLTPLARSASRPGFLEIVKVLLRYGALIDATCLYTFPLTEAVDGGAIETVKLFLAEGANVNIHGGITPSMSTLEVARTPISRAFLRGDKTMINILLAAGAKVDIPENNPLKGAVVSLFAEGVEYLLKHGAQRPGNGLYATAIFSYFNRIRGKMPQDELYLASREECYRILDLLVDNGEDVNAQASGQESPSPFTTPVFMAASGTSVEFIRKVVSHGGNTRARIVGLPDCSILDHAVLAGAGAPSMVNYLLDYATETVDGTARRLPLELFIRQYCPKYRGGHWSPTQWNTARCLLEHARCGPSITSYFPDDLMAIFLRKAIISLEEAFGSSPKGRTVAERVNLFAKLTNFDDRWGPDGISGLRGLTLHPDYIGPVCYQLQRNPLLVAASKYIARRCPKPEPMPDDEWLPAFQLLFGSHD